MSAWGHEQTSRHVRVMSVIPLKADIHQRGLHVRLVPKADIRIGLWLTRLAPAPTNQPPQGEASWDISQPNDCHDKDLGPGRG